ncbi:integrase, catalytic region, zinc finger, CCHC-type containing protein [Tanacetum coccineum]
MNYVQQPMPNPKMISDPTTAIDMALVLMAKEFKNVGNQNGLIVAARIANQNGNGNVVAAQVEGNGNGNNENQIRCYNCQGVGHYARNCIVRSRRRDDAYLQTQLQIAQKEEARIQLQPKEFDFMAAEGACEEIKEIFNMFTQKEQYTDLLESTTKPHLVQKNDNNVIPAESSMDPSGGTVE